MNFMFSSSFTSQSNQLPQLKDLPLGRHPHRRQHQGILQEHRQAFHRLRHRISTICM